MRPPAEWVVSNAHGQGQTEVLACSPTAVPAAFRREVAERCRYSNAHSLECETEKSSRALVSAIPLFPSFSPLFPLFPFSFG